VVQSENGFVCYKLDLLLINFPQIPVLGHFWHINGKYRPYCHELASTPRLAHYTVANNIHAHQFKLILGHVGTG
jgi:hypothetical protein